MSQRSPQKTSYLEEETFGDVYTTLQKQLGRKDLGALRTASSTLRKKTTQEYIIGLDNESYSQYPNEGKKIGWGMKFFRNPTTGEIWGENKNRSEDNIDLEKRYEGSLREERLLTKVFYDDIGQVNVYEGEIIFKNGEPWFEGTSTVIKSANDSKRKIGDQAVIVGRVKKFS